jgi:hypothetical protein
MAFKETQANLMPIGAQHRLPSVEEYQKTESYEERKRIRNMYKERGLKPPHMLTGKPNANKGKPNKSKGIPRPHMRGYPKPTLRGPKPHRWITGPDPERHKTYIPFLKQKAQAMFRKEFWDLTFEQWEKIWDGRFHLRGRGADNLCMMMEDPDLGWTDTNAVIVTRREQLCRQKQLRNR